MERWWRGAALSWLAFAGTAGAAQVTALRAESGAGGATVSLSLSQPVRVAVHDVAVASGAVARVYVDLPRGTRLARGVPRTLTLSRAVTMVRVGRGEGGVVRVVVERGLAPTAPRGLRSHAPGRPVLRGSSSTPATADTIPAHRATSSRRT